MFDSIHETFKYACVQFPSCLSRGEFLCVPLSVSGHSFPSILGVLNFIVEFVRNLLNLVGRGSLLTSHSYVLPILDRMRNVYLCSYFGQLTW